VRNIPQQPHPSSEAVEPTRRLTTEWTKWVDEFVRSVRSRSPVMGTFSFASISTATVTLSQPEASTDYDILYAAPENKTAWTTSKTTATFVANVSSASSATWAYSLMRR
jgi:hypothetical protein